MTDLIHRALLARGMDESSIKTFLRPSIGHLNFPTDPSFAKAVDTIVWACRGEKRVAVFGDYDCDGVCSTAIVTETLRQLGCEVVPRVADRRQGYGFSSQVAQSMAGFDLAIVLDCGTRDLEASQIVTNAGTQLIVIDHHVGELSEPHPGTIVNPRIIPSEWMDPAPCSAGIALLLMFRLCQALGTKFRPFDSLDIAAIATVADMVPLSGVNRILSAIGHRRMADDLTRPGLREVLATVENPHDGGTIGWKLAPIINSPGRLGSASPALDLLLASNWRDARIAFGRIRDKDSERRIAIDDAMRLVEVVDIGWAVVGQYAATPGVSGIVASRLVEQHGKPAFAVALKGTGSARSGNGHPPILPALEHVQKCFDKFGGHPVAAGFKFCTGTSIDTFVDRLRSFQPEITTVQPDVLPVVNLVESDISIASFDDVETIGPFGVGNPKPPVRAQGIVTSRRMMGSDNEHLRLIVRMGKTEIPTVGFGMSEHDVKRGDEIEVVGTTSVNRWNGKEDVQMIADQVTITKLRSRKRSRSAS